MRVAAGVNDRQGFTHRAPGPGLGDGKEARTILFSIVFKEFLLWRVSGKCMLFRPGRHTPLAAPSRSAEVLRSVGLFMVVLLPQFCCKPREKPVQLHVLWHQAQIRLLALKPGEVIITCSVVLSRNHPGYCGPGTHPNTCV